MYQVETLGSGTFSWEETIHKFGVTVKAGTQERNVGTERRNGTYSATDVVWLKPYALINRTKYCLFITCYFLWFISVPHSVPRFCIPAFTVTHKFDLKIMPGEQLNR